MKPISSTLNNEEGFALVATMGLLLALVTTGIAFLSMSAYEADAASARYAQVKMFWKAEETLSKMRSQITQIKEPDGYKVHSTLQEGDVYQTRSRVKRMQDAEFEGYEITTEVFTADNPTRVLFSLTSVEKPKTIADYFMLFHDAGDYPDLSPYFDTGDTIDGRLHSNTFVPITGKPVFKQAVTTGGPAPGYKPLPFQRYTPPTEIFSTLKVFVIPKTAEKLRASAEKITVQGEQRAVLELAGDRYNLRIRDIYSPQVLRFVSTAPIPQNKGFGLFVEGDVEVSGTLQGRMTIGCSGDMMITDDILYIDADPKTGKPKASSTNILGLVAEGNVLVKQIQVAPYIGRGIRIDASIMAMDSTFTVLNYREYGKSLGTMHLWGNVVQYQRGIIGNVRLRGTVEMGYLKSWHYDTRFQSLTPPFMPPLKNEQGFMEFKTIYWKRPDV